MKKFLLPLSFLALVNILAGCGGNNSGASTISTPPTSVYKTEKVIAKAASVSDELYIVGASSDGNVLLRTSSGYQYGNAKTGLKLVSGVSTSTGIYSLAGRFAVGTSYPGTNPQLIEYDLVAGTNLTLSTNANAQAVASNGTAIGDLYDGTYSSWLFTPTGGSTQIDLGSSYPVAMNSKGQVILSDYAALGGISTGKGRTNILNRVGKVFAARAAKPKPMGGGGPMIQSFWTKDGKVLIPSQNGLSPEIVQLSDNGEACGSVGNVNVAKGFVCTQDNTQGYIYEPLTGHNAATVTCMGSAFVGGASGDYRDATAVLWSRATGEIVTQLAPKSSKNVYQAVLSINEDGSITVMGYDKTTGLPVVAVLTK